MIPAMLSVKNEQSIMVGGGVPQGYMVQPVIPAGNYPVPEDPFPYKAHRVTGFLQILLGLAAIGLQVGDMLICRTLKQELLQDAQNRSTPENAVDVNIDGQTYALTQAEKTLYVSFGAANAATGMWTGFLFILTGAIGASITRERHFYRKGLRNAYMTLSILMAVFIAPALFIAASVEVAQLRGLGWGIRREACPWLLLAVGLGEFLLATVAASICCCCSFQSYGSGPVMGSQAIIAYPASPSYPVNPVQPVDQPQPPPVSPPPKSGHQQGVTPPFNPEYRGNQGELDHGTYLTQPSSISGRDDRPYVPDPTRKHPALQPTASAEAGYLHFKGSQPQEQRGSGIYHEIPADGVEGDYIHPGGRPTHNNQSGPGYMNMGDNKKKGKSNREDQTGYMHMAGKGEYVSHSRGKKGLY